MESGDELRAGAPGEALSGAPYLPRLSGLLRETTQTTPMVLDVVDEAGAVVGRVNLRVEGAGPVIAVPIPGAPRLPE